MKPYKSALANTLEIILSMDAILLFLLSIPESLATVVVKHNRTIITDCATTEDQTESYDIPDILYAKITIYFIPFYATTIVIVFLAAYTIW